MDSDRDLPGPSHANRHNQVHVEWTHDWFRYTQQQRRGDPNQVNLIAATYPLTAVYAGDVANLGSTSTVVNQVVLETTSKAMLTSSPNPSTQGQAVTFTATISSPTVIPTGPVTFIAGTTVLGTAQLGGGKAKLVISSLPVGSTKVTVKYNGDSNIAKSSASVIQTVQ